jgi:hypothetical protein
MRSARAGPVHGRAADRLADPGGQVRIEIAGALARIEPRDLREHLAAVGDVAQTEPPARLETHHLDALLGEFVAERAAARTGTDDDDHGVVVQIELRHRITPWAAS